MRSGKPACGGGCGDESTRRGFLPIVFASPATVTAGTKYAIVAFTPGGLYFWGVGAHDPYAAGSAWQSQTSPPTLWKTFGASVGYDFAFKTYVTLAKHKTTTSVKCSPNPVAVASPTRCTATVSHTSATKTTPTGTVSFTHTNTGMFAPESCALKATLVTGEASCSVTYTPLVAGMHEITASYGGDVAHEASKGSTTVDTTAAKCPKGDNDDNNGGGDNDQNHGRSAAKNKCDNDHNDRNGDSDGRGSDGD